jgi:hypothetical protein
MKFFHTSHDVLLKLSGALSALFTFARVFSRSFLDGFCSFGIFLS